MAFLIDTNIAIHARDGTDHALDRLAAHGGAVVLSALSLAELQRGLHRNPAAAPLRRQRLAILVEKVPVIPFDAAAAEAYGDIIAPLGWVRAETTIAWSPHMRFRRDPCSSRTTKSMSATCPG